MAITREQAIAELERRQAAKEELARRGAVPRETSIPTKDIAMNAARAAAMGPFDATKSLYAVPPETMQRKGGVALPIVGGLLGGPIGAAAGEFTRQMTGTAFAPDTVPETPFGRFASVAAQGIAEKPAMLRAVPGVPTIEKLLKSAGSKLGSNVAKLGEALTGAKAKDLTQAAKQGLSTYAAPSMEKAQEIFGEALKKEGIDSKPTIDQLIDPALSFAKKTAKTVGKKLEAGTELTAKEALNARQAVDRIYAATNVMDKVTRRNLAEFRSSLDDIVSNKSGALSSASKLYRKAIVKSNILNPLRITKQGQMSAVAPMVAALASAGVGSQDAGSGVNTGIGYLLASSPAVAGVLATGGGSVAKTLAAAASNPQVRQVVTNYLAEALNRKKKK